MRRILILIVMLLSITGIACQKEEEQLDLEEAKLEESEEVDETEDLIYVYVCGAVNSEGVYELPAGSRVYEAITLAGGFREDAASREINQAEVLVDEMRVYVPTIAEKISMQEEQDGKININRASKEELMSLPGVGASRADSIIEYREQIGAFQSIEDIMLVSGIKEGLFEKIKDFIKV